MGGACGSSTRNTLRTRARPVVGPALRKPKGGQAARGARLATSLLLRGKPVCLGGPWACCPAGRASGRKEARHVDPWEKNVPGRGHSWYKGPAVGPGLARLSRVAEAGLEGT